MNFINYCDYFILIFRHPFLLYPYFIDRWKKGLDENDDSLSIKNELETMSFDDDDDELETMFIEDEENIEGSKKKSKQSNGKENKVNRVRVCLNCICTQIRNACN
jgi:hypothetical protein